MLNGRILRPGEADLWQVTAHKGQQFLLDLRAGRLGSLLDSVLTILDATGKRLESCDDMSPGETDSRLTWKVPADGTYCIRVEDRLPTRGGPQYTYRLDIEPAASVPDFHLKLATDTVNVERGHEARFTVTADHSGGFNGPIAFSIEGLPTGVRATVPNISAGASKAEVVLKADAKARVATAEIRIRGEAVLGGKKVVRVAALSTDPRDPPIDHVAVAVAVPTPFKFTTSYDQAYTRAGLSRCGITISSNGFAGPLQIRVADKQVRYKQGVSGPTMVVPAGADHFDYPLTLAPFMEILRTSRTNVMATGIITDVDGSAHPVTYTTEHQDEQIVAVVSPGRINLTFDPASVEADPGKPVIVNVQLNRDKALAGDVRVSWSARGISSASPRHCS